MNQPSIFVIIVTYNAMKWAERCFTSLRKSSVPVKTIVIDNGSTDGTQDYIKTNFPEVVFEQSTENLGFGKANNRGIELAYKDDADFFYLMNQDAWIFEDSFEKMLGVYDNYPDKEEIGIISPVHLDGSEVKLDIFFELYMSRNSQKNHFLSDVFLGKVRKYYVVDFINAAHWLIPKETLRKVGGFNPYFFHYSEDSEFTTRMNFFGLKTIVCVDSRVVHDGKQDFGKTNHLNVKRIQREQRYLDPSLEFNSKILNKDFRFSTLAPLLKGDKATATENRDNLTYLKKRLPEILNARKEMLCENYAFLNIE